MGGCLMQGMQESVDKEIIKTIIKNEIPDAVLTFDGDSCNFKLIVESSAFKDKSIIQQHKMVLSPLKNQFESGALHALSVETRAK